MHENRVCLLACLLVFLQICDWVFRGNGCEFWAFPSFPIRFSGSRNPNPGSDISFSKALMIGGVGVKIEFSRIDG